VHDLEQTGQLVRITERVDPDLEMAAIHRQVHLASGPALFFENVKGSPFPCVSNLFGTMERARFILRGGLASVKRMVAINADPMALRSRPQHYLKTLAAAAHIPPRKVGGGPVLDHRTAIGRLPQIRCWPEDGGAFILLPQVFTESGLHPMLRHSNMGMYRIQLSGNEYRPDSEIGLHYQIQRGVEDHHADANRKERELNVSIFVGGPPAHSLAAVMPLPEGLPEVWFAGALNGRRFRYLRCNGHLLSAEADFCITGKVLPGQLRPEGPFGDHLGYYSLCHPFPVIRVERVYHRKGAVWPFTVVGRPPQEDTVLGALIHEITAPMVPKSLPGVATLHAVDAAGVHPLLLAMARERYVPYQGREPRELLKHANAILGFGQCALAKYLFIAALEDNPGLEIEQVGDFLMHCLERADWRRDVHFHTRTTIDTLDYSGTAVNAGSKVVVAAAGEVKRRLSGTIPPGSTLPSGFGDPKVALPGVLVLKAPAYRSEADARAHVRSLSEHLSAHPIRGFPLITLCDDSEFAARNLGNYLWVTFTRSNPAHDIHGINSYTEHKHWGCNGPLVIDARTKPHHAPVLEEDPAILKKVAALAVRGKSLHGII
jgi:4-hydroxy-3-polyprenylbenzoate decarboxylase